MKKLSVRLAQSTKNDINDLKQILEDENHGDRQFTNGDVVNQAYRDVETFDDWEKVISEYKSNTQKGFIPKEEPELKTNLTLKDWAENHDYKIHYLNTTYGNCNYQKKDKTKDIEVLITNY